MVVFGNSLIAADRIVNVVRRRLQEQLGDGGRGFLYVDGLAPGPRDRTSSTAEGWITTNIADFDEKPEFRGISSSVAGGVHMSAGPASSRFRLAGESEALIYAPRAGLEVRASGGTWQPVTPSLHRLSLPAGARMLELRARSAGAVVHGVVLEHEHAGVVVDTFGVAGADAMRWARVDDEVFRAGLAARDPDLVVVMLGGNEMKRIAWRQRSLAQVRDQLRAMLRRVEPSITRSCLVIGPIDAVVGERDRRGPEHDVMTQRPEMVPVNEVHRAVAFEEGCAFFDLYTAMGGKDSLVRLKEADALFYDLVHPNDRGLAVLGQLIADALLQSWAVTPQRSLADLNAEATDLLVEVAPLEAEIVGGAAHVAGEADDSILQDALLEAL